VFASTHTASAEALAAALLILGLRARELTSKC
jgi:hypothetical protein